MTFKVCDKCKSSNEKTLISRLKTLNNEADIQIGCQGLCGIGRCKPFVIIDYIPIIADNEDILIERVDEYLKKNKK